MKKKIDNPIWCILHALYLMRYVFAYGAIVYMFLWVCFSWLAGINGTY